MAQTPTVTVDRAEMRDAFEFVSIGGSLGAEAYISRDTGKIYLRTVDGFMEEDEVSDDALETDRYIAVPHKTELDLGRRLVLRFADDELPGDLETVEDLFRRKGAYAGFKRLLESRGALQRWYDYEERATEQALQRCLEAGGDARDDGRMKPMNRIQTGRSDRLAAIGEQLAAAVANR